MKQAETTKVIVGSNEFYIKPFGAFYSANLSGELMGMLVPVLTGLLPAINGKALAEVEVDKLAEAVKSGLGDLSGKKVEDMFKKLIINQRNVSVRYKDEDDEWAEDVLTEDLANELFCQNVDEMYALAWEVIKLNYSGFFQKGTAQFGKAKSIKKIKK